MNFALLEQFGLKQQRQHKMYQTNRINYQNQCRKLKSENDNLKAEIIELKQHLNKNFTQKLKDPMYLIFSSNQQLLQSRYREIPYRQTSQRVQIDNLNYVINSLKTANFTLQQQKTQKLQQQILLQNQLIQLKITLDLTERTKSTRQFELNEKQEQNIRLQANIRKYRQKIQNLERQKIQRQDLIKRIQTTNQLTLKKFQTIITQNAQKWLHYNENLQKGIKTQQNRFQQQNKILNQQINKLLQQNQDLLTNLPRNNQNSHEINICIHRQNQMTEQLIKLVHQNYALSEKMKIMNANKDYMKQAYLKLLTKYQEIVNLKQSQVLLQQKINTYQNELKKNAYLQGQNKQLIQKNTIYKQFIEQLQKSHGGDYRFEQLFLQLKERQDAHNPAWMNVSQLLKNNDQLINKVRQLETKLIRNIPNFIEQQN